MCYASPRMTTKPNILVNSIPLEIRIRVEDPRTGQLSIRTNRSAPTVQILAMLLDATPMIFKSFVEQQAGIVGSNKITIEQEPEPSPEPEKVS